MYRLLLILFFLFGKVSSQDSPDVRRVLLFQQKLNKEFATEETSPLVLKELKDFKSLDFFTIDTSFSIKARFIRTPYETPFIMKTTTGSEPVYVKYGEAHFAFQEKEYMLNIYQNQGLTSQPEYEDYLFLPFTDLTNGESSYAGGRYIDLKIPETNSIFIDFNTSYNPFCAYNDRYSCPIPPEENHLDFKVLAGVKKYKNQPENE